MNLACALATEKPSRDNRGKRCSRRNGTGSRYRSRRLSSKHSCTSLSPLSMYPCHQLAARPLKLQKPRVLHTGRERSSSNVQRSGKLQHTPGDCADAAVFVSSHSAGTAGKHVHQRYRPALPLTLSHISRTGVAHSGTTVRVDFHSTQSTRVTRLTCLNYVRTNLRTRKNIIEQTGMHP